SVCKVARSPVAKDPSILSVRPLQPVLHLTASALIKRQIKGGKAALTVLDMHTRGPAILLFLVKGMPREADPALVKKCAAFVRACHPNQYRSRIGEASKALLAFS